MIGLELGIYLWALAAGAGLAALVAASTVAYTVLRVIGTGFLILLGIRGWVTAWRTRPGDVDLGAAELSATSGRRSFMEGLVVQLANPKAAVFMFAFYPQFVPSEGSVLASTAILAAVQVIVELALYLGMAAAIGRASAWFRRGTIRRRLEAASGTVLIALGIRVAVDR